MRTPQIPIAKTCQDCPTVFLGTPRRKFCHACATRRSRASDKEKAQRRQARECYDLSPGQIETQFQEALAQIRRERKHEGEMTWQMSWKYE